MFRLLVMVDSGRRLLFLRLLLSRLFVRFLFSRLFRLLALKVRRWIRIEVRIIFRRLFVRVSVHGKLLGGNKQERQTDTVTIAGACPCYNGKIHDPDFGDTTSSFGELATAEIVWGTEHGTTICVNWESGKLE